jgi:hypothetical protein
VYFSILCTSLLSLHTLVVLHLGLHSSIVLISQPLLRGVYARTKQKKMLQDMGNKIGRTERLFRPGGAHFNGGNYSLKPNTDHKICRSWLIGWETPVRCSFGFVSLSGLIVDFHAHKHTGVCLPHGLLRLSDSTPSGFQDSIRFQP